MTAPAPQPDLHDLCYCGETARVIDLLRTNPEMARLAVSPQWENATPLCLAALGGHTDIVRELIRRGADIHCVSNDGGALLMAAWGGHLETARLLLDEGANPNLASASGETALLAAAVRGFLDIRRLLIERGANVNAQTTHGTTHLFATSPPSAANLPCTLRPPMVTPNWFDCCSNAVRIRT